MAIGAGMTFDIVADFGGGLSVAHLMVECFVVALSVVGMIALGLNYFKMARSLRESRSMLVRSSEEVQVWRRESEKYLRNLAEILDRQFDSWGLSDAEREVARLVLNGYSVRVIATKRFVVQKTIRTQLSSIYFKSGLSTQQEFISFFLPLFFVS